MTKQNIISFYESNAHNNQIREILEQAKKVIDSQISLQNCAVVLDIDETSLNHYKSLKDVGFPQEENHSIWNELITKTSVEPIKPTLDFYQYCINKGIKVFFISARFATYLDATKEALQNAGYIGFEDVFVFPEDISTYSSENFKNFKAKKEHI
jgi:predicted secreted acid phosphatase